VLFRRVVGGGGGTVGHMLGEGFEDYRCTSGNGGEKQSDTVAARVNEGAVIGGGFT